MNHLDSATEQKGQIVSDQVVLYILYALAGGIAGFIRFLESKKKFGWRATTASVMLSSLSATAILGWWFENQVLEYPTRCLAIALLIGYSQPNIAGLLSLILKSKGINEGET